VRPEITKQGGVTLPFVILAHGDRGSEGRVELHADAAQLVVRPERDAFDAGAPAKVTVLGANAGDRIALRMTKGSEPSALGSCVVTTFEAGCVVTLDVPRNVPGLAWLHAMSLPGSKGDVKTGKRMVLVGGGARDLGLKVTPDRPFYAPRDKATVEVAVTGVSGAPVKAQLGVAVADEAVFALADVRPDLEKTFFTIDKDLELLRRPYSYSSYRSGSYGGGGGDERALPPPFEKSAAYDPNTERDVRAMTLAVLTTMPDVGAADATSSSAVAERADAAVSVQRRKLVAWAVVLLALYSLLAFAGFATYGWSRFRGLSPADLTPESADTFRLETRALYMDWLIAALAPPALALFSQVSAEALGGSGRQESFAGVWLVLAAFCCLLLVRAVLRVRRTMVAQQRRPLARAVVFLPVAALLAHLALVFFVADRGHRLDDLLGVRSDALFLPVVIAGAAQLTCGVFSVIRQTLLREVTTKGRVWLFFSRASFLGLPITLLCAGGLVFDHVKWSRVGWDEYVSRQMEERASSESGEYSSDNKEGGTGTRAKGEEGVMGRATAAAPAAAAAKPGGGGGHVALGALSTAAPEPVRTRDYFPETLLWAPEIITDDTGRVTIPVSFADSITTWRFGLRAVSKAGQLGSTSVPLVVKQDFFVDASLPPLLTQGDEIAMPVTVYSYLPEPQDVRIEVEGAGLGAVGAASTVLHLDPREARGFRFVVRADKAGDRVVHIKATGKTRADALERKVKIVPDGLAVVRTTNATFTTSGKTDIELPGAAIDGGNDLYVKIYGGPLSMLSEGLDGVFTMPHGCFEQTSSTTYPSVLALEFLQRSKAVSPELEKKARQYIGEGYQRIVSFEVPGGGFSIFGKSPASTVLSAYGLLELADMARVASVDEQVLRRTRDWLYGKRTPTGGWAPNLSSYEKAISPSRPDDVLVTAYVAWALATAERPDEKDARLAGVLDVVAKASGAAAEEPYALALRANALLAGKRNAEARPLLDRLAAAMVRDEEGVHWTSKSTGVMYSYGASMDVEVTGLASHALSRAELQPEARAGAISWLAARRNPNGVWSTTQATIAAMRALLDEAKPAPKEPQDLTVLVDGETAETYRLELAARDVHRLIGLRKWSTTGKHTVEVRATGGSDIAYQLVTQHYLPWQRQALGKPSPLVLDVAYAPAAVPSGGVTSCRVHLAWHGTEPARMPLVEIGIPPAFEVDTTDLDKLVAIPDGRIQRYTVERGKVTLYLVDLPEDKPLSIELPLRALRPARVVVPASSAYLYYEPEVHAETVPVVVRSL